MLIYKYVSNMNVQLLISFFQQLFRAFASPCKNQPPKKAYVSRNQIKPQNLDNPFYNQLTGATGLKPND